MSSVIVLAISRQRVYQLLHDGKLVRGPGGGVTRDSIEQRRA